MDMCVTHVVVYIVCVLGHVCMAIVMIMGRGWDWCWPKGRHAVVHFGMSKKEAACLSVHSPCWTVDGHASPSRIPSHRFGGRFSQQ
jgi:hypothetical protein